MKLQIANPKIMQTTLSFSSSCLSTTSSSLHSNRLPPWPWTWTTNTAATKVRSRTDLCCLVISSSSPPWKTSSRSNPLCPLTTTNTAEEQNGDVAEKNFKETLQLLGRPMQPELIRFNRMINARAKSGPMPPGLATQLLNEVKSSGLRPDEFTYNTLISSCSRWSNFEEGVKIYNDMLATASNCKPNIYIYNTMISLYVRCGMTNEVEKLFKELKSKRLLADVVTYNNSLIESFRKMGNVEKVSEITYNAMRPILVMFNEMINARARSRSMPPGLANEILNEMKSMGLCPNEFIYNSLISSCSRWSNFEEGVKIYNDMQLASSNCKPDIYIYNAMISLYGRCGMTNEAEMLFKELQSKGFVPDIVTYTSLIYALRKEGNVEKVSEILVEMDRVGIAKK